VWETHTRLPACQAICDILYSIGHQTLDAAYHGYRGPACVQSGVLGIMFRWSLLATTLEGLQRPREPALKASKSLGSFVLLYTLGLKEKTQLGGADPESRLIQMARFRDGERLQRSAALVKQGPPSQGYPTSPEKPRSQLSSAQLSPDLASVVSSQSPNISVRRSPCASVSATS